MTTLVIDGNNVAYRAFHTPQSNLSTKAGEPTGVMLGTLNMFKGYLERFPEATKVIVAWDAGKAQWRKDLHPAYKATRRYGDNPEEKAKFDGLFKQIDQLHEFLPNLGIHSVKMKGWEGDDLMYAACQETDGYKLLVTSDKDMYQLIDGSTHLYSLHKEMVISPANFYEVMGVTPEAYMGYRALLGDNSDNIPGVPGIGDKTAKSLMDKYGHIDNVLNATGVDKQVLMKSARTKKIFDEANLKTIGLNHRIMNFKYVEYEDIRDELIAAINAPVAYNGKAVREFLMRWQFVSVLANYMPWATPFMGLGQD